MAVEVGGEASAARGARSERVRVGLIGYDYWCGVVAGYLDGTAFEPVALGRSLREHRGIGGRWRWFRSGEASSLRIVHAVNALAGLRALSVLHALGARIICHWIGSDYRMLAAKSRVGRRWTLGLLATLRATHLSDSPELAADLAALGLRSEVVRLVPRVTEASVVPLPNRPAALAYWSDEQADFYGRPLVYALARRFPHVPFRIVGPSSHDALAPPNVEFLGFQRDMDSIYREISVLVRVLPHDSISAMVLEALARGRDVIYSREFPHTRRASDEATAVAAMEAHLAEYGPNADGARYIAEHFSPRRWARQLTLVYERMLRE